MIELLRGQVLSLVFMNSDIIAGLVNEHMTVEPVVVQKPDDKNTLLVFTESEDIEKICNTLQSIEMWLGHNVNIGCDVATTKRVLMGINFVRWGEKKLCQWKMQACSDLGKCQNHKAIIPAPVWPPR